MGKKDRRVDAYIEKSAPFARPMRRRLRKLVHQGCPGVVEEIKWGVPHFNTAACSAASPPSRRTAPSASGTARNIDKTEGGTGQFGRITALSDLQSGQTILGLVREARRLADSGIKAGPGPPPERAPAHPARAQRPKSG